MRIKKHTALGQCSFTLRAYGLGMECSLDCSLLRGPHCAVHGLDNHDGPWLRDFGLARCFSLCSLTPDFPMLPHTRHLQFASNPMGWQWELQESELELASAA